eukprot:TRINITY_DN38439_c0_g2_i2.p1 TRINITY_DN38439_c0_g2~~TRINITY_DN38439_c0_g2_i2.p1  ORF type:complete len:213 (+),score=-20.49 TRINITY_DN38439_c0_g2_i2:62-700(+)
MSFSKLLQQEYSTVITQLFLIIYISNVIFKLVQLQYNSAIKFSVIRFYRLQHSVRAGPETSVQVIFCSDIKDILLQHTNFLGPKSGRYPISFVQRYFYVRAARKLLFSRYYKHIILSYLPIFLKFTKLVMKSLIFDWQCTFHSFISKQFLFSYSRLWYIIPSFSPRLLYYTIYLRLLLLLFISLGVQYFTVDCDLWFALCEYYIVGMDIRLQ